MANDSASDVRMPTASDVLAAHARLRVIPRLQAATLPLMAAHVAAVTVLSVLFVAAGISLRTCWLG